MVTQRYKPIDGPTQEALQALVFGRFDRACRVPDQFFNREVDRIAQACWSMARRFYQGGRLIAFGNGPCATDAQHVAVEFVHPLLIGPRLKNFPAGQTICAPDTHGDCPTCSDEALPARAS